MMTSEILNAESRLFNAMKASDVNTLNELLHDDLLFITPAGQVVTKAMDLDSHRAGTMIVEDAAYEVEQVNVIGDTAISVVLMKARGKMLGQPLEGQFRYIRIWQLSECWKVIGGSCTMV